MVKWTAESERRLLLAIISVANVKSPNWDEVMAKMGPEFNMEGVRQKYWAIRRGAAGEFANEDNAETKVNAKANSSGKAKGRGNAKGDPNEALAMQTPKRRPARKDGNDSKRSAQEAFEAGNDHDDDEEGGHVSTKIKREENSGSED